MRVRSGSWSGFALSLCLSTSLVGCGNDLDASSTSREASAITASSRTYLVSFASGTIPSNTAAIISAAGGSIVTTYTNLGIVLAKTSSSGFASVLRGDARIDRVAAANAVTSKIEIVKSKSAPHPVAALKAPGSDPLSGRQWDMDQIQSPQARAVNAGKKSVLVGMLDSGVDITHPDLAGQIDAAASVSCYGGVPNTDPAVWTADLIGHGSHVAGTIAAKKNGIGIVGVAPGVRLAEVKLDASSWDDPNFGLILADAFVCGIDWAIGHNFDLMNASLSIDPFTGPIDDIFCSNDPDREAVIKMVRQALQKAANKKITLISSTANMFLDLANLPGSGPGVQCKVLPVQLPHVIGVSSVGYTKQLSWFSDYGKGAVDLTGPGGDNLIPDPLVTDTDASGQVLSSMPENSYYFQAAADWNGQVRDCSSGTCATYAYIQGTSQAAPHVTGVAALAISKYGKMSPEALLAVLSLTATPLPCPASPYDPGQTGQPATCKGSPLYNNFYGAGEVNALAVVR